MNFSGQQGTLAGAVENLTVQIETVLLENHAVADCAVFERQTIAGAELVGYVVPTGRFSAERLLLAVRAGVSDLALPIAFMPVSAIPLREDGSVNETALAALSLADAATAARCEERLHQLPGIRKVELQESRQRPRLLHVSDLLPHWKISSTPEGDGAAASKPETHEDARAGTRPALSRGEPLDDDPTAPDTLQAALLRAATEFPDHGVIYVQADGADSFQAYPALLETAERVLGGLRRIGLKVGDPVLFQLERADDFVAAFWGCTLGGFIPVPISIAPAYDHVNGAVKKLHNAWQMLDHSIVVASDTLAAPIRGITQVLPADGFQVYSIGDLMNGPRDNEWHASNPADVAILLLTSGSTGAPKAVMQSHQALLCRSTASRCMNRFSPQDVSVNWLPLDHVGGIVMFHLHDVAVMCTQVHASTQDMLTDPLKWLDWLDKYHATSTWAPNFAYGLINAQAEEIARRHWDLSKLRFILNAGEAIVSQTARRFLSLLAPHGLRDTAMHPSWGMSETCSAVTFIRDYSLARTSNEDLFVEVGEPVPGFAMRIVDGANRLECEGKVGRLQVQGPSVLSGYFRNPIANRESFTEDGWFITGDLGIISNGRLTITGREKDVIIINGVNYYAHEIESVVEEIPGIDVSFTAAFAVRDIGIDTERLAICFSPSGGTWSADLDMAALLRQVRSKVVGSIGVSPAYLIPVDRETIPKTSIGKIQRPELAQRLQAGAFDDILKRVDLVLENARTIPDWFFRKAWRRRKAIGSAHAANHILIFADEDGIGEGLAKDLAQLGSSTAIVRPGSSLERQGNTLYSLDASDPSQYVSVFDSVLAEGGPLDAVVHLWACDTAPAHDSVEALNTGVLSALHVAQALQKAQTGHTTTRLLFVTRGAQSVTASEESSVHAAMSAFAKTVQPELPWVVCQHIDLEATPSIEDTRRVELELAAQPNDVEVAYRGGDRWVSRLVNAELGAAPKTPLPFIAGGFYLLTGGLGAIASEAARYLLKEFGARLLLLGRTPLDRLDAERRNALNELQLLGGAVRYQVTDVCDALALEREVSAAEAEWQAPLAGVLHLAGTYRESLIADESRDDFKLTVSSKFQGTRALFQMLCLRPDAFFVGFSSINGFFGGFSSAAYAVANALLDGCVEQECAKGRRAISLAWSLWDEVGMSRGYSMKELSRAQGYLPVSRTLGMLSFLAALQSSERLILIGLDASGPQIRRRLDDAIRPLQKLVIIITEPLPAETLKIVKDLGQDRFGGVVAVDLVDEGSGLLNAATPANAAGEPATDLERKVTRIWVEVLGTEVDLDRNFFDLGGTSLLGAQVYRRIHDLVGKGMTMTDLFRFPTVRALCRHLTGGEDSLPGRLKADGNRGRDSRELLLRRRGKART